ncbi:hypothetical protein BSU04_37545 [Caballeronia sordidicola]|jgi:hypothetical protein|uniref:PAAR motif-containing protein n=2 Tax=Caballeronia sordidicola TaxID=196367 RepID=A0A226WQJ7_CABSO|nr:hypothetical protein BSU04_37545 [Caballeronia sordidicola]
MRRSYIKQGDRTTSGATVNQGIKGVSHRGTNVSFLGAEIYCPRCKSTGYLAGIGPRHPPTWMKQQPALHDDLAICKCKPTPPVIASQNEMFESYGIAYLAKMGFAPNGDALTRGTQIAPAMLSISDFESDADAEPGRVPAPTNKGSFDCSYLDGSKGRIDAPADLYKKRNPVQLIPGKQMQVDFPSGESGPATKYDAIINGQTIPILVPLQKPPVDTALAEPRQIAEALGKLPDQNLPNINRVVTNAAANPDDAKWAAQYGQADFYSAATANIQQGVAVYPWHGWTGTIPQRYIDSTMVHETAHQVSEALRSADPGMRDAYRDATSSDGQAPSLYAQKNLNEDFAESANMYWTSKGTPCEEQGRTRYPARYQYFDSISG